MLVRIRGVATKKLRLRNNATFSSQRPWAPVNAIQVHVPKSWIFLILQRHGFLANFDLNGLAVTAL